MLAPCIEIIDDIEDLISSQDITPKERYSSRKNVKVRARKKQVCDCIFFIWNSCRVQPNKRNYDYCI